MNDLARKDFFTCLGIWLALEVVGFGILPLLGLTAAWQELQLWFWFSLLVGIGGAILTAGSAQLQAVLSNQEFFARRKILKSLATSVISWLGLLGIGFPIFVISLQICQKIFGIFKS
ncbi:MAG: hypothetical protein MUF72_08145 [Elainella sp. Prado103]|jgi:hypothetical protein|nr:hypothetical protein [Elainella sp. Prado103]